MAESKADKKARKAAEAEAKSSQNQMIKYGLVAAMIVVVALMFAGVQQAAQKPINAPAVKRTSVSGRDAGKAGGKSHAQVDDQLADDDVPRSVITQFEKAATLQQRGKTAKAEKMYKKIIEDYPGTKTAANCYANIGIIYITASGGSTCNRKGIQAFEKAISIDASLPNVNFNLGRCYFQKKRYKDSIKFLERSIEHTPTPGAYEILATAYFYENDYPNALRTGILGFFTAKAASPSLIKVLTHTLRRSPLTKDGLPELDIDPFQGETLNKYRKFVTVDGTKISAAAFYANRTNIIHPTLVTGLTNILPVDDLSDLEGLMEFFGETCGSGKRVVLREFERNVDKRSKTTAEPMNPKEEGWLHAIMTTFAKENLGMESERITDEESGATLGDKVLTNYPMMIHCRGFIEDMVIPKFFANDLLSKLPGKARGTRDLSIRLGSPRLFAGAKNMVFHPMHVEPNGLSYWTYQLFGSMTYTFFVSAHHKNGTIVPEKISTATVTVKPGEILYVPGGVPFQAVSNDEHASYLATGLLTPSLVPTALTLNEQGADVGKNFAKELRAQVEILNKGKKDDGFSIAQKDVPLNEFGRTYMQVAQHNWEVDESAME